MKNRLVIFDFDGTIANVPERPNTWAGKDWWGHKDSLKELYYLGYVNNAVVDAFKEALVDPSTETIMVTGRRGIIAPSVRSVLRKNGLLGRRMIPESNSNALEKHQQALAAGYDEEHSSPAYEEYYCGDFNLEKDYPKGSNGKVDGSTLAHKFYVFDRKVNANTEFIEIWEDRDDHMPYFIKFCLDSLEKYGVENGGKLKNIVIHRVHKPVVKENQGVVQDVPIKKGMIY
jgi:hypothetical protein